MRVENMGDYWEVDDGEWLIDVNGEILTSMDMCEFPPFIYDLRDSLMEELDEGKICLVAESQK